MPMQITITLSDRNAEQAKRQIEGTGIALDQFLLLAVLAGLGVFPVTTLAKIRNVTAACKKAPAPIREQVCMVLGHGASGELVGQDLETALGELVDLVDPEDKEWSATA